MGMDKKRKNTTECDKLNDGRKMIARFGKIKKISRMDKEKQIVCCRGI